MSAPQPLGPSAPEIGHSYHDHDHDQTVEVRAVCASHVVCDGERIFTRAEFVARFIDGRDRDV